MIERQLNKKVKVIRSHNAWQLGSSFENLKFLSSQDIIYQTSCVATPQQNGVVGMKHKHLLEFAGPYFSNLTFHINIGGMPS